MYLQLKKYLAAFFLFLFLFPMITETGHWHIHQDDSCCTGNNMHFHAAEHHCAICDFAPFIADTPSTQQFFIAAPETPFSYITYYKAPHVLNYDAYSFSLRAPPFVS